MGHPWPCLLRSLETRHSDDSVQPAATGEPARPRNHQRSSERARRTSTLLYRRQSTIPDLRLAKFRMAGDSTPHGTPFRRSAALGHSAPLRYSAPLAYPPPPATSPEGKTEPIV